MISLFCLFCFLLFVVCLFVLPEADELQPSIPQATHKGDHWPPQGWKFEIDCTIFFGGMMSNISILIVINVLCLKEEPVFVEDDIPHLKWALGKLLSSHHLHVHVLRLRLAARLHQTLQNLRDILLV